MNRPALQHTGTLLNEILPKISGNGVSIIYSHEKRLLGSRTDRRVSLRPDGGVQRSLTFHELCIPGRGPRVGEEMVPLCTFIFLEKL